jgi:hypothetical protein
MPIREIEKTRNNIQIEQLKWPAINRVQLERYLSAEKASINQNSNGKGDF